MAHRYLTQDWLDEFKVLAEGQPPRPGATFRLQWNVKDGPDGDIGYYWQMEDGKLLEACLGTATDPDVVLTLAYKTSVRLQQGDLGATNAFMQGKIKAKGDIKKIMKFMPVASSAEWKELDEKARAMTQF